MVPRCKICTWHCKEGEWEWECIKLSRKGEKRQYDRKKERERKRPADAREATKVGWREQFEDRTDGFIGKNSQSAERINAAIDQSWGRIRHLEQLPKKLNCAEEDKFEYEGCWQITKEKVCASALRARGRGRGIRLESEGWIFRASMIAQSLKVGDFMYLSLKKKKKGEYY